MNLGYTDQNVSVVEWPHEIHMYVKEAAAQFSRKPKIIEPNVCRINMHTENCNFGQPLFEMPKGITGDIIFIPVNESSFTISSKPLAESHTPNYFSFDIALGVGDAMIIPREFLQGPQQVFFTKLDNPNQLHFEITAFSLPAVVGPINDDL